MPTLLPIKIKTDHLLSNMDKVQVDVDAVESARTALQCEASLPYKGPLIWMNEYNTKAEEWIEKTAKSRAEKRALTRQLEKRTRKLFYKDAPKYCAYCREWNRLIGLIHCGQDRCKEAYEEDIQMHEDFKDYMINEDK
jgi:hypothetical protein